MRCRRSPPSITEVFLKLTKVVTPQEMQLSVRDKLLWLRPSIVRKETALCRKTLQS